MSRDWSRESWHKVFARDAGGWAALSFDARGLYRLLQDEASRDGVIDTGEDRVGYIVAVYRLERGRAQSAFLELIRCGLVIIFHTTIQLPVHAEQQGTITNSSERVRRFREKSRNAETLHVTPEVSVERKERKKETNKEIKKEIARARETAPVVVDDPKAKHLAVELAANKKFASLDHAAVAEELLGGLGMLAFNLTEQQATDAVIQAAAEAETGANERRLRQVLGWKLKDQLQPKKRVNGKTVQGEGENNDAWLADLMSRTTQL